MLLGDDAYTEGDEIATLLLQHPSAGAALGTPNAATLMVMDNATEPTANPIDDSHTFVAQRSRRGFGIQLGHTCSLGRTRRA